jgi:D-alanine-D-alanine ligase-like ATP-grasp enzyme
MGRPSDEISNINCSQLFGIDILIDENLKAWLLEINAFPSLTFTAERVIK